MTEILSREEFETLKSKHHNQALLTIEALAEALGAYESITNHPPLTRWRELRDKGWLPS